MYRIAAAITSAHVYWIEKWCRRGVSDAPQRGHCPTCHPAGAGARQQPARGAGGESGLRCETASVAAVIAAAPAFARAEGLIRPAKGYVPSAQTTRDPDRLGSKIDAMAASNTTSRPTAYIPMPGTTVASCAILMSATRMPSSITSLIDQGSTSVAMRSSWPTQRGAGGRFAASSTASMNAMKRARRDHRAERDHHGGDLAALHPHFVGAADDRRRR